MNEGYDKDLASKNYPGINLIVRKFDLNNIIIFIYVFAITLIVRYKIIFSYSLISDDMHFYAWSLYGNLYKQSIYFFVYSILNKIFYPIVYVRIFYIAIYAFSAVLTYSFMSSYYKDKCSTALIVSLSFINPCTAIYINFLNGSYNILYYFLFIAGANSFRMLDLYNDYYKVNFNYLTLLVITTLFISLSTFFSTNALLMGYVILLLPWWKNINSRKKRNFLFAQMAVITIPLTLSSIYNILYHVMNHPYSGRSDLYHFNIKDIIEKNLILGKRLLGFFQFTIDKELFGDNLIFSFVATSIFILLVILRKNDQFKNNKQLIFSTKSQNNKIIILFYFCAFLIVTMPFTVISIIQEWYFPLPSILLIITFLLAIKTFTDRKKFFILSSILFTVFLVASMERQQIFNRSYSKQKFIRSFIEEQKNTWKHDAQLMITIDQIPPKQILWNPGRSVGYLQVQARRPDIKNTTILPEQRLNKYPFNDRDDIVYKKRAMADKLQPPTYFVFPGMGYDKNKPTYLYRLNLRDRKWRKIDYLMLLNDNKVILFSANEHGIKELASVNCMMIDQIFFQESIERDDVIFINYQKKISDFKFSGNCLEFDGTNYIKSTLVLQKKEINKIICEFIINSDAKQNSSVGRENYPPMPLLSRPLRIYQIRNHQYRLVFQTSDGLKERIVKVQPNKWYKFNIVYDFSNRSIKILVNNVIKELITNVKVDFKSTSNILIGKGSSNRYWRGKIGYINFILKNNYEKIMFHSIVPDK